MSTPEGVEFLKYQLYSKATDLGLEPNDEDANKLMYGIKCHSVLFRDYTPYECHNKNKEHYVNTQTIYCVYGKVPKAVYNLKSTYTHILFCYGTKVAREWLRTYITALTTKAYDKLVLHFIGRSDMYFVTTLANVRYSKYMADKVFDILSTWEIKNPHLFINRCMSDIASGSAKKLLTDMLTGIEKNDKRKRRRSRFFRRIFKSKRSKKHSMSDSSDSSDSSSTSSW